MRTTTDSLMTRDDTVALATSSSMMHYADRLSMPRNQTERMETQVTLLYTKYPIVARALGLAGLCRVRRASKGILHTSNTSPMTPTVARLIKVSHITNRLLKYFPTSQTTRTRLFNQCTRVAAIIQSSDLRGGQSNFIHSRRTRDACEAARLVTRVVASLTNCMTQRTFNSPYNIQT